MGDYIPTPLAAVVRHRLGREDFTKYGNKKRGQKNGAYLSE
jgi:hypothetical protein